MGGSGGLEQRAFLLGNPGLGVLCVGGKESHCWRCRFEYPGLDPLLFFVLFFSLSGGRDMRGVVLVGSGVLSRLLPFCSIGYGEWEFLGIGLGRDAAL